MIKRFIAWLVQQLGSIYVWGAQGEYATPALIQKMETDPNNRRRAMQLYNARTHNGEQKVKMYDCSGLIVRFLLDNKLISNDMTAAGLYGKCHHIERTALKEGDLVFRYNGSVIHHVGVYIGGGMVIHSRGRDYGVVREHIDANGESYWNKFGRMPALDVKIKEDKPYLAAYTGDTFVNLRAKPSADAEKLGKVEKGEKVLVLAIDANGWADVIKKHSEREYSRGYCIAKYLKEV